MFELEENTCAICSYPFVDEHHIFPRGNKWGDKIETEDNKVFLCSNHHRAIHFLMFLANEEWSEHLTKKEADRKVKIFNYIISKDNELYHFYKDTLEPKIKLMEEYYAKTIPELIAQASSA